MCLAVPAKVINKVDMLATIEVGGVSRDVSLMLLPDAKIGDYVLIHAGFAVQIIDEESANQTMELLRELMELEP